MRPQSSIARFHIKIQIEIEIEIEIETKPRIFTNTIGFNHGNEQNPSLMFTQFFHGIDKSIAAHMSLIGSPGARLNTAAALPWLTASSQNPWLPNKMPTPFAGISA